MNRAVASPGRVDWTATDGVRLVARVAGHGREGTTPVICLPGLTRNGRDFEALAEHLADRPRPRATIAFDLRGRGESDAADPATYTPMQETTDVLAGLDVMGVTRASIVGTSRGGIVAMLIAATRPGLLERVVLNDVGPFIEPAGLSRVERAMRAAAPAPDWPTMALRLAETNADVFPLFETADWERYARQLCRERDGEIVFDYDPGLVRVFDDFDPETFRGDLWQVYAALRRTPVMAVRGALSDLVTAATVEAMRRCHPVFDSCVVPDQGHAPVLWERSVLDRIAAFLDAGTVPSP